MTESARDEALRLAREAGGTESTAYAHRMWLAPAHLVRLIAVARQRPGWVWVPKELTPEMARVYRQWHDSGKHYMDATIWREMLAAAPKPGEGI